MSEPTTTCHWNQDDDGNWHTDCDNMHIFIDGTPAENKHRFCAYCGRRLKQHIYAGQTWEKEMR